MAKKRRKTIIRFDRPQIKTGDLVAVKITIERKHRDYIRERRFNLSAMVRGAILKLIKSEVDKNKPPVKENRDPMQTQQ